VLRSYLLTISAGITRRYKVVDRHCPCAPDKDQERQSNRDNVILVSFTFLVSHPIHEEAIANFDRHYRTDHFYVEGEPGAVREIHWHSDADEWQYYSFGVTNLHKIRLKVLRGITSG
jgi:hypothetical protein